MYQQAAELEYYAKKREEDMKGAAKAGNVASANDSEASASGVGSTSPTTTVKKEEVIHISDDDEN